jgi:hypothetical protein
MPKRPLPPNELPPRDPDELADKMSNGQSAVPARRRSGREEVDLRHSYSGCRHRSHLAPTANPARRSRRSHRRSIVADGSSARRCSRTGSATGNRLRRTSLAWTAQAVRAGRRAAHPHDAAVLADLDAELHRLPLGVPACSLGEGEEHGRLSPSWLSLKLFTRRSRRQMQQME